VVDGGGDGDVGVGWWRWILAGWWALGLGAFVVSTRLGGDVGGGVGGVGGGDGGCGVMGGSWNQCRRG